VTKKIIGLLLFLVLHSMSANASLIGDEVSCGMIPGSIWDCTPLTSNIVGSGSEYTLDLVRRPFFEVDLGANSVALNYIWDETALGMEAGEVLSLSSLDWAGFPGGGIIGIENFLSTATSGIDVSDISFGPHNIDILLHQSFGIPHDQQFLSFDLIVDHGQVPAPATLALFGLGLAGLGWSRRKKT